MTHLDQLASSAQHAKQAVIKPQHAQHGGAAVTAGVKAETGNVANLAEDSVGGFYEKELMMYLTARVKSPQGEAFYSLIIASYLQQLYRFDGLFPNVMLSMCFAMSCVQRHSKGAAKL